MSGIQTKPVPYCPDCGSQMALRKPKSRGGKPKPDWKPFWGCSTFPECRGTRNILDDGTPDMWESESAYARSEDYPDDAQRRDEEERYPPPVDLSDVPF